MKTRELKDKRPAEVKQLEKALLRRKWTSREKIRQGIYTDTDKALGAEAVKDIGPKRKTILDLMIMAPDHEWVNYFPMIPLTEAEYLDRGQEASFTSHPAMGVTHNEAGDLLPGWEDRGDGTFTKPEALSPSLDLTEDPSPLARGAVEVAEGVGVHSYPAGQSIEEWNTNHPDGPQYLEVEPGKFAWVRHPGQQPSEITPVDDGPGGYGQSHVSNPIPYGPADDYDDPDLIRPPIQEATAATEKPPEGQ
jgi:hypothetical protein